MNLLISALRTDGGTQPRAALNPETITEYAEAMQSGAVFPPVIVFYDRTDYWLADGFHRLAAVEQTTQEAIAADVRQGTRRDAVLFSVGANAAHGMRRTNADKRRAVETLLGDAEWVQWSNGEIARRCVVSVMTVGRIREDLISNNVIDSSAPRLVLRGGTTYEMNTAAIGTPPSPPPFMPLPAVSASSPWGDLPLARAAPPLDPPWEEPPSPEPPPAPEHTHYRDGSTSSRSIEWYTPAPVLERVLTVLGAIDLDPCSNSHAAPNVPAAAHYTQVDNGLLLPWMGRVFMNPPYGREIDRWVGRLVAAYEDGDVSEALALVPGRIDTNWFQPLYAFPMCNIRGRLVFGNNTDTEDPAFFPSVVVYLGPYTARFIEVFQALGPIVQRIA